MSLMKKKGVGKGRKFSTLRKTSRSMTIHGNGHLALVWGVGRKKEGASGIHTVHAHLWEAALLCGSGRRGFKSYCPREAGQLGLYVKSPELYSWE